jgi:dTDP-4-amino-4,6-dideoxy-D-galactose acyltransferase
MKIDSLAWDTAFFGFPVGCIRLKSGANANQLHEMLSSAPFRVVYIMLDQPSSVDIVTLESIAQLVDMKKDYTKEIQPEYPEKSDICIYTGGLSDELMELALLSGHDSRFRTDPKFAAYFPLLYEEWIEGALSGRVADAVLIDTHEDRLSGFITISAGNPARIGLLAVHPEYQGMGIGSKLLAGVRLWCSQQGCTELRVATQGSNLGAIRLYEKNGFTLIQESAIFHWWNTVPEAL